MVKKLVPPPNQHAPYQRGLGSMTPLSEGSGIYDPLPLHTLASRISRSPPPASMVISPAIMRRRRETFWLSANSSLKIGKEYMTLLPEGVWILWPSHAIRGSVETMTPPPSRRGCGIYDPPPTLVLGYNDRSLPPICKVITLNFDSE